MFIKQKKKKCFAIAIILFVLLMSCGRIYHIKGRVVIVSHINNTESEIREIINQSIFDEGIPIKDAMIRITYELDSNNQPSNETIWQETTISDSNGYFEIYDYAMPSRKNLIGLEISKEGFKSAYTTYWDYIDKQPQLFYIILVKE